MAKVNIEKARKVIESTKGRIFTVAFIKRDGTRRVLNCRLGVPPRNQKEKQDAIKEYEERKRKYPHLITVYDMQKKDYRSINLETLEDVRFGGKSHDIT